MALLPLSRVFKEKGQTGWGSLNCASTAKLWQLLFLNSEPGTSDENIGQDIPWQTNTANVFTCNYQLGSYKKDSLGREDESEVQR